MKTALITGIAGFVGSHLAEFLLKKDYEVHGLIRYRTDLHNIKNIKDKLILHEGDITDYNSISKVIKKIRPDEIYHLAAMSFVPFSWKSVSATFNINVIGTINMFEAIKNNNLIDKTKIQIACSSEEYGKIHEDELPVKETNPLRPLSPYGVSKVTCDMLAYQYYKSYGLKTIRTRAFNHCGPRRGEAFVTSNFAKQIASIERGDKKSQILVGNLNAKRDFTDVRDMVRAYWLAVQHCIPGEEVYNICSGKTYTIRYILETLLKHTDKKIKVVMDPSRLRPSDVPILLGDCSKFKKVTNWKRDYNLEQTLIDILNYWREELKE